jgi:hypothetical protein
MQRLQVAIQVLEAQLLRNEAEVAGIARPDSSQRWGVALRTAARCC